jgi:phytoene dehydrogenase-like protein
VTVTVSAPFVPPPAGTGAIVDREALTRRIAAVLEERWPGFAAQVEHARVLTPGDLAMELAVPGGHPLHADLALDQLWLARPALGLGGYRTAIDGLYVCGPGTHPGVGPLGASGLHAGRAALRDLRAIRRR